MTAGPQVAVVGCGRWGSNLVRNYSRLGALRAVVDIEPAVAKEMSETYGVPTTTLDDVLLDPLVDGVVVAVPAADHAAVARQALAAGKHVFVEKPLAHSSRAALDLIALARERELVVMPGHTFLYSPPVVLSRS